MAGSPRSDAAGSPVNRLMATPAATTGCATCARMMLELDLSPGVLVAPSALADLDADADRQVTDAEAHAYAERILADIELRADGGRLSLTFTKVDVPPYLTIQAG